MGLNQNLQDTIARIEKARTATNRHAIIKLIAVSKYTDAKNIQELYECGQRAFGENKVQDLEHKSNLLSSLPLEWYFLGTLQTNKINALLRLKPARIEALHSLEIATALQKRLERDNTAIRALLQVNSSKETTKSGFEAEKAFEAYLQIKEECPNILLEGLMCIGAQSSHWQIVADSFETTQRIFSRLEKYGAKVLSMGMSDDFELAIHCGSNCVRLGSILFKHQSRLLGF